MYSFRAVFAICAVLLASTTVLAADEAVVAPRDGLLTHDRRDGAAHAEPAKKMRYARSGGFRLDKEVPMELKKRAATVATVQTYITQLQTQTLTITTQIVQIAQNAGAVPNAQTTKLMTAQFYNLQTAIQVAVSGITGLLANIKNSLDLNNLGLSVAFIIFYTEYALNVVQSSLQMIPALAPLITTLDGILGGPLMGLLTTLQGSVVGLLPVVNQLLASVGLAPVLAGVGGLVNGLLGGLGLKQ